MGPHQKAVMLTLENKYSSFFLKEKICGFFFYLWVVVFFLFLLNYEMTHASQLKINLIAAAVGSWRAVMARGPLGERLGRALP